MKITELVLNIIAQSEKAKKDKTIACINENVSFSQWKRELRKQQLYYESLKFKKLNQDAMSYYYDSGFTPIEACNDIITAV